MTPAYTLRRLLELSPLTTAEIVTYTGWSMRKVQHAIEKLRDIGQIRAYRVTGTRRDVYAIAD